MADGLSLAVNIMTVVHLVGEVAFSSYRYINEVKGASKSLKNFERELKSLKSILLKLRTFTEENPVIAETWDLTAPLERCGADMARIKLGLVPKKKKWGVQLLRCQWPFKEKETLEFIERIERLKSLFDLAMGELQQSQLKKIEINVQHLVQAAAQGSHGSKNTEDQIIQYDKPNKEVVVNWLYSEAFDKRHTEISGRRQPNTGEWILKELEVQDWENGKSKSRLLWGYGIPGAGKTFLSSLMIDHLKNRASTQSKCGVAYIYFNYSEQEQQNPLSVLGSLTKQLACQLQELPSEINMLHKNIINKQKNPNLEELYNIFLIIAKSFTPGNVFLVFDALDECKQDTHRKNLLPLFHQMVKDGTNLFITSREFPDDIQTSFKNSPKIRLRAKNEDIKFYIEQKIVEHPRAHRLVESAKCQNEIVSQLKECANGMFLMVSFHVKYLCQQVSVKQLLAALKGLKDSSSKDEPTMDPTYDRVIERIKLQEGNCTELALKILFWLVSARRVLTVRELQVAVSIEGDCNAFDKTSLADRNTLLDVCAGLMTIDQENSEEENDLEDTVRLAHYTIQEYLIRKSIVRNNRDMGIATACITFISYNNFTQGACIHHKSDGPDGSHRSDEYRSYLHPFLKYVVVYLIVHFRECDESLTTELVLQFLQNPQLFLVYVEGHMLLDDSYCSTSTPLHFAVGLGHTGATKSLIEMGADIQAVTKKGSVALHIAAYNGHKPIVKLLLEMGANIKAVDKDGWTALHCAANSGHGPVVKLLLEMGADIKDMDKDGSTALHRAAYSGHGPVVKLLLEMGADIKAVDNDGWAALHCAANWGYGPVVKLLLEMGADIKDMDKDGWTALHRAANSGHGPVVKLLLEIGADIKDMDKDGWTALHCAAISGHGPVVKLLLEMGADIKAVDNYGWTSLHHAADSGHGPVVKLLLEMGADIKAVDNDGWAALHRAAYSGHGPVVKLLLEMGADIKDMDKDGWTSLHHAADSGHGPVVKLLLEMGADIKAVDNYGWTSLHHAADSGHGPVVKLLLEMGADIKAVDNDGWAALHRAADSGHGPVVKLLLEMGADIKAVDNDGWAALHRAAYSGHGPVVKLLLEMGADIKDMDKDGWTSLHHAADSGHGPVVKLLLEMGADIKAVDNYGWTSLHHAADSGHGPVVKLLLEMGADIKAVDNDGWAALHRAADSGHGPVVKLLLEMGADIKAVDNYGWTSLHHAADSGHGPVVKLLLEMGADIKDMDKDGWTALHCAAYSGHGPVVKLLLEMGADIKDMDKDGLTAILLAKDEGHEKVVQLLEEYMADGTAVVETDENVGGGGVSQEE